MDIIPETKEAYKNKVQTLINEIKKDDEKNDEEITRLFQSNFINNHYSDSEDSNLDTITIDTSPLSERYYSLSNSSSSDKLSGRNITNDIIEKISDVTVDCGEREICGKWAKYFLSKCYCIDDDE